MAILLAQSNVCLQGKEIKFDLEDLINLIIQLPGDFRTDVSPNTDAKIEELTSAINFVRAQTTSNTAELINLKTEIVTLHKDNEMVIASSSNMKEEIFRLEDKLNTQEIHINGIEQYLRVNNLEIVGLPPAESQGTPIEDTLLEIFNGLPELSKQVSPDDIDICHIMPSDRKDDKLVVACRFISRKMKLDILQAKKNPGKFTFKNHEIFINDHYLLWLRLKRGRLAINSYGQKMVRFL